MRGTAKSPTAERPTPEGRAAREARIRRHFRVALIASAAAHGVLLALPPIEVPLPSDGIRSRRPATHRPAPARERPIEVLQIVQIRPPGPASAARGSAGVAGAASIEAALAVANAAGGRGPAGAAASAPTPTVPVRSAVQLALSALSPAGDSASAPPSLGPPKRGVYERRAGARLDGSGRRAGSVRGSGPGLGSGSGGVTIIGPGGDCITPGTVPPIRSGGPLRTGGPARPGRPRGGSGRP